MKDNLIRFFAKFGLFQSQVRDPFMIVHRAEAHLAQSFYHCAAFRERGYALPEQQEAIDILRDRELKLVGNSEWIVL